MTTTFSVAACLSRLADAEWLKVCEGVRRFSPTVGPLGQWRALCEGGWTGPVPPPLLVPDEAQPLQVDPDPTDVRQFGEEQRLTLPPSSSEARSSRESAEQSHGESRSPKTEMPQHDHLSSPRGAIHASTSSYGVINASNSPQPPMSPPDTLRLPYAEANSGSVRSLSAFPSPPTHFPLPPPLQQQQLSNLSHSVNSSSNINFPSILSESPVSANEDLTGRLEVEQHSANSPLHPNRNAQSAPSSTPSSPEERFRGKRVDTPSEGVTPAGLEDGSKRPSSARAEDSHQTAASSQREVEKFSSPVPGERSPPVGNISISRGDYFDGGREFGVEKRFAPSDKVRTVDGQKKVEQTDGSTSGSLVAEMRNRYSNNVGSCSIQLLECHVDLFVNL